MNAKPLLLASLALASLNVIAAPPKVFDKDFNTCVTYKDVVLTLAKQAANGTTRLTKARPQTSLR
jgi:hypothetical protein